MAHSEACQLFIEEQIREGLAEGKTPYSIGKELTAMIERLFEASIPTKTLESRAFREKQKITSNEVKQITPENVLTISEKQNNQVVTERKQEPGPGRPLKYQPENFETKSLTFTDAMTIASFVISHLERIRNDDPKRKEAFTKILKWINGRIKQ